MAGNAVADGAEEQLRTFLAEVRTMEADFNQILLDEGSRMVEESSGRFYLERPDRFRWSYTTPYSQEIIADGKLLWIYDSELEQVTVKNMDGAMSTTPALLLSSNRPLEENFVLEEAGNMDGVDWVRLEPRSSESTFSTLKLGFDRDELVLMELTDTLGQTTRLRFSGQRTNLELDQTAFQFSPPEGADVIRDDQ